MLIPTLPELPLDFNLESERAQHRVGTDPQTQAQRHRLRNALLLNHSIMHRRVRLDSVGTESSPCEMRLGRRATVCRRVSQCEPEVQAHFLVEID